MSTRQTGYNGEQIAADFLKKEGLTIITTNYYAPGGEVDIVAEDDEHIVFVEVKARANTDVQRRYGRPGLAVNAAKRKRLVGCAYHFMSKVKTGKKPRIDIIEIYLNEKNPSEPADIKWYKSAVGRGGRRI